MGQTELQSRDTEQRLRALEQEVDRERRIERRQARRAARADRRLGAGRMALWAVAGIVLLGLLVKLAQIVAPLLVLVLVVAALWWVISRLGRRAGR